MKTNQDNYDQGLKKQHCPNYPEFFIQENTKQKEKQ